MSSRDIALAAAARRLASDLLAFGDMLDQRRSRPRRAAAPRPSATEMDDRDALWDTYLLAALTHGRGKAATTKLGFAMQHPGIGPGELSRWLSRNGKKWIAAGSSPDLRIREELAAAMAALNSLGGMVREVFAPQASLKVVPQ